MSSPYAAAEMLQQEIEDRGKAHRASEQKLVAENAILRRELEQAVIKFDAIKKQSSGYVRDMAEIGGDNCRIALLHAVQ